MVIGKKGIQENLHGISQGWVIFGWLGSAGGNVGLAQIVHTTQLCLRNLC